MSASFTRFCHHFDAPDSSLHEKYRRPCRLTSQVVPNDEIQFAEKHKKLIECYWVALGRVERLRYSIAM